MNLDGLGTVQAKQNTIDWLESRQLGTRKVNYKLRDWLFARQRYWGEPFPVSYPEDSSVRFSLKFLSVIEWSSCQRTAGLQSSLKEATCRKISCLSDNIELVLADFRHAADSCRQSFSES